MKLEEVKRMKRFSNNQLRYLKENNLMIIRREELEKFRYIEYKKPIELLVNHIIDIFFSQFKEKAIVYCKVDINDFVKFATEDVKRLVENFMETVYDYNPSWKQVWSGKELKEKTIEAIKRNKVFELVYKNKKNDLIYVDGCLYLNRKKAEKVLNNLNRTQSYGKFILIERKII